MLVIWAPAAGAAAHAAGEVHVILVTYQVDSHAVHIGAAQLGTLTVVVAADDWLAS